MVHVVISYTSNILAPLLHFPSESHPPRPDQTANIAAESEYCSLDCWRSFSRNMITDQQLGAFCVSEPRVLIRVDCRAFVCLSLLPVVDGALDLRLSRWAELSLTFVQSSDTETAVVICTVLAGSPPK